MKIILEIFVKSLAVFVTGYILSAGVTISSAGTTVVVAIVLGVLNFFVKPFIMLLTLPVNIMTLGLFTFFINAFMVELASWIVPGFVVNNFWWAMLFSLILAIINVFLQKFI